MGVEVTPHNSIPQLDGNDTLDTTTFVSSLNSYVYSSSLLSLATSSANSLEESWFSQCQNEEDPCSIPLIPTLADCHEKRLLGRMCAGSSRSGPPAPELQNRI